MLRFKKMEAATNPEPRGERAGSLGKAESWLSLIADREEVWNPEVLVYLRSRGSACDNQIRKLIESWKEAERSELGEYKKRDAQADTSDIVDAPAMLLRDFWGGAAREDYASEAAMLRTVEWCEIGGFEQWWQRLARIHREALLSGGVANPVPASYWLFSMLRSDHAIELMRGVLDKYLEVISLPGPGNRRPWMFDCEEPTGVKEHLPYASSIIFARHRLPSSQLKLVHAAVETICRHQDNNGGWPTWTGAAAASIQSTAMAVHALALERPSGWRRMAARAQDWLWSTQQKKGFWVESGTPGPAYLTVLVLDAIALANDESRLTFRRPVESQVISSQPAQPGEAFSHSPVASDRTASGEGEQGALAIPEAIGPAQPGITKVDLAVDELPLATAQERRAAVQAYIDEVFEKTEAPINKTTIWKYARYKTRSEFERWQRNDPKTTKAADQKFRRILNERPHLKK